MSEINSPLKSQKVFSDDDTDEFDQDVANFDGNKSTYSALESQKESKGNQFKKLPKTLLSAPLKPEHAALLNDNDRR